MSYDTMDHAGWVERNIEAAQRGRMSATDKRRKADGRGWYAAPQVLNPFQRRAFTMLGIAGGGIYNAPIEWESIVWRHPRMLWLLWRYDVATWDGSNLTSMVLLAHDAAIRLTIAPGMRFLRIGMHEREPHADGAPSYSRGHPTLEQAVARHRQRFPAQHHIHFAPALAPISEEASA
jgi:hypothetical protein